MMDTSRHPYPNGWFRVAFSSELPRGGVKPLKYLGRDLVLFRGDDGKARVLDAYCPHMGTHLGHGGKVEGSTLRCPFHGWRFDGEGVCREVPFAKKIPPAARLACWPVEEVNGIIFVHHDAEGRAPSYRIPAIPEFADGARASRSLHLRAPFSMLMENSLDVAHLSFIHDDVGYFEPGAVTRFETEGARMRVTVEGTTRFLKRSSPARTELDAHGPGFMVLRTDGPIETVLLLAGTPVEGDLVDSGVMAAAPKMWGGALVRRLVEPLLTRAVLGGLPGTKKEEVVWEHLRYNPKPLLSSADGPIMKFRAWHGQFWSQRAEAPGEDGTRDRRVLPVVRA
jgi:3-ketosteroid 9alpha-monooxygenase subunit A